MGGVNRRPITTFLDDFLYLQGQRNYDGPVIRRKLDSPGSGKIYREEDGKHGGKTRVKEICKVWGQRRPQIREKGDVVS